jgi:2-oxoglutarate ferredoxin oxidoreductase subunit delta
MSRDRKYIFFLPFKISSPLARLNNQYTLFSSLGETPENLKNEKLIIMFGKRKERGIAMINIGNCTNCGSCIMRCRHKVIEFILIEGGKQAKVVHTDWCSGCGKCANVCNNNAITIINSILCKI